MQNDCSVKTSGKILSVKVIIEEKQISVYVKDDENLNFPCLKVYFL